VEAFLKVADTGAEFYCFNSRGYWKESDDILEPIPLQTSLTLQTAVLMDQLEWEPWSIIPGAALPTRESVEKILPGYYDRYNPYNRMNLDKYYALLKNRFQQRIDFLTNSDLKEKPELQKLILDALKLNI